MMDLLTALEASAFSTFLRESTSVWAYPTVLMLHTVGLALLVGVNAAFDLRLLGFARDIPLEAIEKWFPAMWFGFWLNTVTGLMLFATDPIGKGTTTIFLIKLGIVLAAVALIIVLRRTVYGRPARVPAITRAAQACALASIVLWIAAIATGRFMAYVSEV